MSLTNWQLFFQDLERSTQSQPSQDNEVLTLIRHLSDVVTITDGAVTATSGAAVVTVGSAVVGYSQIG